ncbi:FtsK/SpoIIIE domain-containing protein [Nocardia brasiliensis]|uniref:Cell division protein FtsK n=1 Tax=Nocardia brasiliensis (strain ATCC 700358 / HUJEG-1) TaxID=1133849 RepID=K0EY39_NOCB7|nr:FtsK/SpoIIIE domain-containing protein [Nocardia brasiliensis]AFU01979.1 cell division protein FtsK [Nocardia brasiliensis ATCC 700358]OCF87792.1 cell division protein FtsK [Nocardia brasiliensis]
MQLAKGQNTPLHGTAVDLRLSSESGTPALYVAMLGTDDRVATATDFRYPGSPDPGPVSFAESAVHLDLLAVPNPVQRMVVLAAIADTPLPALELTVTGPAGATAATFTMPRATAETAIIVCEVYRRNGQWKLRAVGQGYESGLAGAASDFGFDATIAPPTEATDRPHTVDADTPQSRLGPAAAAPVPPSATPTTPAGTTMPATQPRRDRSSRGLRATERHASTAAALSPSSAAPRTSMTPPPPAGAYASAASGAAWQGHTPVGETLDAARVPVLARRTELAPAVDQVKGDAAASIARLLRTVVTNAVSSMPSTSNGVQRIQHELAQDRELLWNAYETVRGDVLHKYRTQAFTNLLPANWYEREPAPRPGYSGNPEVRAEHWLIDAAAATEAVRGAGIRVTSNGRAQQRRELIDTAATVLGRYDAAVRDAELTAQHKTAKLFTDVFAQFRRQMSVAITRMTDQYVAVELGAITPCPGEATPVWQAVADATTIAPSPPTRMVFPLGLIRLTQARIHTELTVPAPPGGKHEHTFTLPLEESTPPIPVLLDLDDTGGIVTDSTAVVENLTLDMLATLPAGRLKIDVVDPMKVGASMNFLYGVGEAGEKIYGQKVWGSHNVNELLTELENHVAFVTQKYLQGTHETLTAYNRAAGEVAEPYRLLLLFDHPHAFTRDGRMYDDESLKRLERLATVGRRAGVLIAATTDSATTSLDSLATAFTGRQDTGLVARLQLPTGVRPAQYVTRGELDWRLRPYPLPSDQVRAEVLAHIERSLATSGDTQVAPKRVHELAVQAMERAVARGTQAPELIADPHDPATWWQSSVDDRVVARFGRMGATDVAELRLDSGALSSALIGGRTGSGKSVLLHSIILGIALQYSPAEVEFYLIDFKEGVEFKPYATPGLPHAKVVAIETNRDFGISVLESLDSEIARRAALFKNAGQGQMEIGRYRQSTGEPMPRIVLIIDEFHMLLEQDDATATRGAGLLDRIIRQGRAFGVHTLLASQSVSGGGQKIRTALNQIPNRLVLASSTQDSEQLLAEGNADAQLLSKPGEGIINDHAGQAEANNRFQCAYWPTELRATLITQLRDRADAHGFTGRPAVFEGDIAVAPQDYPLEIFTRSDPRSALVLPMGAPMSLDPPLALRLGREPGNNLLVVDPNALSSLALQIAVLRAADIRVEYVDFAAIEQHSEALFARLCTAGAVACHRRKLGDVLDSLLGELAERTELDEYHGPARVLFLVGLHRARELNPDAFDEDSESAKLARLLRHGPEVGLHVVGWADRYASLQRRLDPDGLRQFGFKVLGPASEDDSRVLIDSEVAANLTANQFAVDDYDNARTDIVRRFADPGPEWLDLLLRTERGHDG